jgi:selenocysteine lyase/cysteine desulfurase
MIDWDAIRNEFPALQNWTYLNTASFGQLSRRTTEAVARHFVRRDEYACEDFLDWFDDADQIRAAIARLIHCQPEDVAFFVNASAALSLLAGAIPWTPGDRVLTLEDEFPNHLYWAEALAGRFGVHADIVPFTRFRESLASRTRLVMVSMVNYTSGLRPPLEEMARACRECGAVFYVDGTQGLGALDFDCGAVAPDMLAVDGYKWMLAPNGASFAFIAPGVRKWLEPAMIGWRSDKRWRQVNALHHGAPEFKDAAERYEGGILAFPALYGLGATVKRMLELRPENIERRVLELAAHARGELKALGASFSSDLSPIIAARLEGRDAVELSQALRRKNILTAARHGNLRISTHFYNNEADIARLVQALREIV